MTVFGLKIIAILTMCLDHAAVVFGYSAMGIVPYEMMVVLRVIGRIAFPIFIFLIANGYSHTKNKAKYLCGMAKFAAISQFIYTISFSTATKEASIISDGFSINPLTLSLSIITLSLIAVEIYVLIKKHRHLIVREKEKPKKIVPGTVSVLNRAEQVAKEKTQIEIKEIVNMIVGVVVCVLLPVFSLKINDFVIMGYHLNIFYTLAIGILSIYIVESFKRNSGYENALLIAIYSLVMISIGSRVDYGIIGCIFTIMMYLCRKTKTSQCICLFIFSFLIYTFGVYGSVLNPYVLSTIFAIPLIILYNGNLGIKLNKNIFYIFYPLHLLIITVLEMVCNYLHFNVF